MLIFKMVKIQGVSQVLILCPLPDTDLQREYSVCFDHCRSQMVLDGLSHSKEEQEFIKKYRDMFVQLGYYPTSNVSRVELLAVRDAAVQMSSMRNMFSSQK